MKIGIPKEIKNHEYRVGATPSMVANLIAQGHSLIVESGAGCAIGFKEEQYVKAGAKIVKTAKEVYDAEMIIKVKEPQKQEVALLKEGQILFCFLHLAPEPELTKGLLDKKVVGIAYETVKDKLGRLPLLVPMSEIAGRLSIQVGATYLQMNKGGKGILLGGAPGIMPASVVVIGGGVAGKEAVEMALGTGARVTVIDIDINRLRTLREMFGASLQTLYSTPQNIEEALKGADLVIGAPLIPGKLAPKVITEKMVQGMQEGSVIVDIAIDQGGCSYTSKPTSFDHPVYKENGVTHYCVTNMPGASALTSTLALTNATLPYAISIANLGWKEALNKDPGLYLGLNVEDGKIVSKEVLEAYSHLHLKTAALS